MKPALADFKSGLSSLLMASVQRGLLDDDAAHVPTGHRLPTPLLSEYVRKPRVHIGLIL